MNAKADSELLFPLAFAPYKAATGQERFGMPGNSAGARGVLVADAFGLHRQHQLVAQGPMVFDAKFD